MSKLGYENGPLLDTATMVHMMHRMLEAHILMCQFVVLLLTSSLLIPNHAVTPGLANWVFATFGSGSVHVAVKTALTISFWLRIMILPINLTSFYYYEKFHEWVGFGRWEALKKQEIESMLTATSTCVQVDQQLLSSKRVQPLGKRSQLYARRTMWNAFDWLAVPVSGLLFYVAPQFHAQLSHLFTDRLDYQVAAKPTLHAKNGSEKGDEGYFEGDDSVGEEDKFGVREQLVPYV
jgi:hypothetical protein